MSRAAALLAVLIVILSPLSLLAQDQAKPEPSGARRVVTTTRLVALFSDLENQLMKAAQRKDEATLNRFLSDDFELWTPAPPGDPTPREDWIRDALASRLRSFKMRQLAVRTFGDTALVSFLDTRQADSQGKNQGEDFFVVDVWVKSGDNWQVAARYASRVQAPARRAPVKPSGKQ